MRRFLLVAALLATSLAGCSTETEEDLAEPTVSLAPATTTSAPETSEEETTTESSSSTSSTKRKDSPPDCSDEALQASPGFAEFNMHDSCEDGFARVGVPRTDHIVLVQWNGKHWTEVDADGVWDGMGMERPCFDPGRLEEMGVPKRLADKERRCGVYGPGEEPYHMQSTTSSKPSPNWEEASKERYIPYVGLGEAGPKYASHPACDGRGILILDSIIDYGVREDTFHRLAIVAMEADPSGKTREYTTPGQCASLRAQVDGNDIYPVYLDYGHDTDALCAAKANYGGNARLLNNSGEYVDPC